MKNCKFTLWVALMTLPMLLTAQAPENWFNLSYEEDGVYGAETERAYTLLKGKDAKKVVVAVIDSGVDEEHEDLTDVMWVNSDEIPGNGIDDDENGYIDDIHGWNFIGNPNGENVDKDNLEVARLYNKYRAQFADVNDPTQLTGEDREEYLMYLKTKKEVERGQEKANRNLERYKQQKATILAAMDQLEQMVGSGEISSEMLEKVDTDGDSGLAMGVNIVNNVMQSSEEAITLEDVRDRVTEGLQGAIDHFTTQAEYHYNPDFDPRPIVGDDYSDPYQRDYGNNDYEGPDALHGTHVAGIIGANRENDLGMKGVADHVEIMTIRAVPDGDERDKDVAAAIVYAVDNGASIINMSFGKGYKWNKEVVDEAVKYAEKNDVLLVHAAGNSSQNNDESSNFPNDSFEKRCLFCKKQSKTWIEVGALSYKTDETLPARFSNYGKEEVDLFAPGVEIYSTLPDNEYRNLQGTSMASPVVAGVAALIRSYFPDLTAKQVREILLETTTKIQMDVKVPGTQDVVPFEELSVTGGAINAYEAVKKAMETKGKKKSQT